MTAEDAIKLYYQTMAQYERGDEALVQDQMQLHCWDQVLAAIRKDYEQENERLRQRVRDLEKIVVTCMESAAT